MKILVIEDDKGITDYLIPELNHEGFETILAETGRKGIETFKNEKPDLILLDVMLPELNGIEVLRRIREISDVPIIMETARGDTIDKINGLNIGADDYLAKPFEIEELIARINALLRRTKKQESKESVLKFKDIEIKVESMVVTVAGTAVALSKTEYFILKYFLENQGRVLSRNEIIDAVWGKDHYIDENIVDVYIGYVRSKISKIKNVEYIRTVRGVGFILEK